MLPLSVGVKISLRKLQSILGTDLANMEANFSHVLLTEAKPHSI